MFYNPSDWYWIGQPVGQSSVVIYASAAKVLVAATAPAYVAWLALLGRGNRPTPWPKDATGAVTIAALDQVLTTAFPPQPPTGL